MTLVAVVLTLLGLLLVAGFAVVMKTLGDHRREAETSTAVLLDEVVELKGRVGDLNAAIGRLQAVAGALQATTSGLRDTVHGMRVDVRAHLTKLDEIKVDLEGPVSVVRPPARP